MDTHKEDFMVDCEAETRASITPKMGMRIKGGLIGMCKSEAVVHESKVNGVFERLKIQDFYSIKRLVKEGIDLGKGRELRVVNQFDDIDNGGTNYHLRVIDYRA